MDAPFRHEGAARWAVGLHGWRVDAELIEHGALALTLAAGLLHRGPKYRGDVSVELNYIEAITRESARFSDCLARVSPTSPVPSCPGWTASDLLWHLTEVQLFWGIIVRDRLDDPDTAETKKPPRPEDYQALQSLAHEATRQLVDVLVATPAPTRVWTWATDQTAGFVLRRQAHEALIHRLDAELTLGDVTPLDPVLAADGVDELLRVMYGSVPAWGSVMPDGSPGRVMATDSGRSWDIGFSRFRGTSPNTGTVYDEDMLMVPPARDMPAVFTVSGTAADLDRWLWGRGDLSTLDTSGDAVALERFTAIIASGVQ